jgi:murein DD-endopeptidase MepM/ murein hydrolase activator NlpD
MDRRAWKEFITRRSSIWTMGLCMAGVIVLGTIAATNHSRDTKTSEETEIGQVAYLEEEPGEDALFPTLDDEQSEELALTSGGVAEDEWEAQEADAEAGTDEESAEDVQAAVTGTDGEIQAEVSGADTEDGETVSGTDARDGETVSGTDAQDGETASGTDPEAEETLSGYVISQQELLDAGVSFSEGDTLMWPAAGTILIDYSMDGSVYFPTLNQYKYNPALIIGSDTGNQVLASSKGIVESINVDEETGTTLVLNIGDDYRLTYGQLKELAVSEGDVVEAGELLGYISEPTKYYSEEGSNLYFAMTNGDEAVDPVLYLE